MVDCIFSSCFPFTISIFYYLLFTRLCISRPRRTRITRGIERRTVTVFCVPISRFILHQNDVFVALRIYIQYIGTFIH